MMLAVEAATLASLIVLVVSLPDEPAVEDSQFDWPLKLKLWFRASSAWADSVSSLMRAWRTATMPVMLPRTRIANRNNHSPVSKPLPQSSCQSLRNIGTP